MRGPDIKLVPFIMQAFDVERECNGLPKIWNVTGVQ